MLMKSLKEEFCMEKKLKIADFAELIGVTPKTVYKMLSRNEIITVNEKLNNRPVSMVVTNDEQIEHFRKIYGKLPNNNGNELNNSENCNDILTDNETSIDYNNHSQNNINSEVITEMLDKVMQMNQEYNDRIERLNNELVTTKAQVLLIEDKKNVAEGDKNHWQKEYFKLDEENKTLNKKLEKSNKTLSLFITVSITLLFTFIGALITYNITKEQPPVIEKKQEVIETQQSKPAQKVTQRTSNGNRARY